MVNTAQTREHVEYVHVLPMEAGCFIALVEWMG